MSSTSSPRTEARAVAAACVARGKERLAFSQLGGFIVICVMIPVIALSITRIIYANRPDLLNYAAVAIAANGVVFACIFFSGEILDRERITGTLRSLFLAPCSRYSWLIGSQLVNLAEGFAIAAVTLLVARLAFDVRFDPDPVSVAVVLLLTIVMLWGFSMVLGAVGLLLKQANQLSNLVYPIVGLLGGVQYPVSLLPDWLRLPARLLPFGYGFEALAAASLNHAELAELGPQLLPLTGFAIALPIAGILTFNWLERVVRARGELDLY